MNMGLDFSEIAVIMALVLIFFGSKEIPNILRQVGRLVAQVRVYTDRVRKELNDISNPGGEPMPTYDQQTQSKKDALRKLYLSRRKNLSDDARAQKSAAIWETLKKEPGFEKAKSVLVYVEVGAEVATRQAIREMLAAGKRVVVPYANEDSSMGVGEIADLEKDIVRNGMGVYEPAREKRDNFFKSDLQFVICPGVAFDVFCGRLGRGRGCFDRFCKELKGRVPVYGLAFDCQIMGPNERLPFAYHDIVMDQVITENGLLIKPPQEPAPQAPPTLQPAG
jgi:5-formyltetrahydrofolate cyclo-ligase